MFRCAVVVLQVMAARLLIASSKHRPWGWSGVPQAREPRYLSRTNVLEFRVRQ